MDQTIDRGRGDRRVCENSFPFRKGQVTSQHHATAFITFCQQCEHDLHLRSTLLHVPHLIDNQPLVLRQSLDFLTQLQFSLCHEQVLHEQGTGRVFDFPALRRNQLLRTRTQQVTLPRSSSPKPQHVLLPPHNPPFHP